MESQFLQSQNPQSKQGKQQPAEALIEKANEIERRLKILEDRYSTLRKKTQTTDENLLASERRFTRDFKAVSQDVLEIKRSVALLQENMAQMAEELSTTAKRPEFRTLEAYLSFIEPMQFVTRQDLKSAILQLKKP
jgi:phage-related minor tail protein